MYERLTKWIPTMKSYGYGALKSRGYGGGAIPPWVWPPEFSEFLDDVSAFSGPLGSKCLKPDEISLAADDKEFLDSLEGEVIVAAIWAVFGADRIVEGSVISFANAGVFHKFLVRLKELDEGKPIVKPKKEYAYYKRLEVERVKREEERKRKEDERKRKEARIPLNRALNAVVLGGETTDLAADIDLIRRSAEAGDVDAQYAMGQLYVSGRHEKGVDFDQDYAQAVKWFRMVAERNEQTWLKQEMVLGAQHNLAGCYLEGKGVEKSEKEAVNWYRKAAEGGNRKSQFMLGACYEKGWGVKQDNEMAAIWFRKAAENGLPVAQYRLGIRYFDGDGVEKDEEKALAWLRKAAEGGDEDAKKALKILDGTKKESPEVANATYEPSRLVEIVFGAIFLLFMFYMMKSCSR